MGLFDALPASLDASDLPIDAFVPSELGDPDLGIPDLGASPDVGRDADVGAVRVAQLSAGIGFTCALAANGTIRCIGDNRLGQLGDGTIAERRHLVGVQGIADAVQISVGHAHVCARRIAGDVVCWGSNAFGQLGDPALPMGEGEHSRIPVTVPGLIADDIACGAYHTCVRRSGGSVVCWGGNELDTLGVLDLPSGPALVQVPGVSEGHSLSAGFSHSCAVESGTLPYGPVRCWGNPANPALGAALDAPFEPVAVVADLDDARQVSAGWDFSCAARYRGLVSCWGRGDEGQLGIGIPESRDTPVELPTVSDAVAVCTGYRHACHRASGGGVWCWGNNDAGQLGNGTTEPSNAPVPVQDIDSAVEIACGFGHTCARLRDERVVCWGGNLSGQLGDGTTDFRVAPLDLPGTGSR